MGLWVTRCRKGSQQLDGLFGVQAEQASTCKHLWPMMATRTDIVGKRCSVWYQNDTWTWLYEPDGLPQRRLLWVHRAGSFWAFRTKVSISQNKEQITQGGDEIWVFFLRGTVWRGELSTGTRPWVRWDLLEFNWIVKGKAILLKSKINLC